MLDFLDNRIAGCIALFILLSVSVWYIKPKILFDEDGKSNTLEIGSFNVNMFGVSVIIISIIVYYFYAMIRYNF